MKKTIPLGSRKAGALVLVLALGLAAEVANADFVFGEPTNLGSPINTSYNDGRPCISADGLTLYFSSTRPGGQGSRDIWLATRATTSEPWGEPVNLGPQINTSDGEGAPILSADGLSLYFNSNQSSGYGQTDIWVTTRALVSDIWSEPVNLGPTVNSSAWDAHSSISADGLSLFFGSNREKTGTAYEAYCYIYVTTRPTTNDPWGVPVRLGPTVNPGLEYDCDGPSISADGKVLFFYSNRPGGIGGSWDLWMARRAAEDDEWGTAVNLGPTVNDSNNDDLPLISPDGSTLFFVSERPGGFGERDIWQVPIEPVVDLNGDGIVDCADICIMVDHWGTDEPLCDIGPTPLGDGIVDVQDLIVLAEYLLPVGPEEVNVNEENDGGQIELEQGQILVVTLKSNPTTGYGWEVAEIQESILEQMGEAEFKPSETSEPPIAGAGGWEIFRFKAIGAGQMTLQLVYLPSWEEGVESINTFSIEVVVN